MNRFYRHLVAVAKAIAAPIALVSTVTWWAISGR
jgi:hypothetical protein